MNSDVKLIIVTAAGSLVAIAAWHLLARHHHHHKLRHDRQRIHQLKGRSSGNKRRGR